MIKDPEQQDDDPFLSRWSKRKGQADAGAETQQSNEVEPQIPLNTITPSSTTGKMLTGVEADRLTEPPEPQSEQPLTDDDMPGLDSLDESSDFSGFMSPGVSARLRKLALKKLFAGAGFNIRDGLDDYDDDFTSFPPLGDIITCDMKHRIELAEQRKREAEEAEEAERLATGGSESEALQAEHDQTDEVADDESDQQSDGNIDAELVAEDVEDAETEKEIATNQKTSIT